MTRNAHRLTDRVALVTGASRGIGRAVAERFAREGATVAIHHVDDDAAAQAVVETLRTVSAAEGHGTKAHFAVEADVGGPAAVARMFQEVTSRCGDLHILVNNAGMQVPTPGDGFDDDDFVRVIEVDLIGPALCSRHALRIFLSRP